MFLGIIPSKELKLISQKYAPAFIQKSYINNVKLCYIIHSVRIIAGASGRTFAVAYLFAMPQHAKK